MKIEILFKIGKPCSEIATIVGYSKRTIEREIKKGLVTTFRVKPDALAAMLPNSKREYRKIIEYSSAIAENKHIIASAAKGKQLKIGSQFDLVEYLEQKVGNEKMSPYAALEQAKIDKTTICRGNLCKDFLQLLRYGVLLKHK